MNAKHMNRTEKKILGIFLIIGIGLLAGAVFALLHSQSVKNSYGKTRATIEGFTSNGYDSNHERSNRAVISYQVDGESYSAMLSENSSSWYVGKEITIYYDKEHPENVTSEMANILLPGILGFIGVLFTLLGGIGIKMVSGGGKKKKKLMESGQRIYGQVANVDQNTVISFNGKHPWVAECTYHAPDGKTHVYCSENLWSKPEEDIIGKTVSIYIDPKHENRYYVDMEAIMQEAEVIYH